MKKYEHDDDGDDGDGDGDDAGVIIWMCYNVL